MMREITLPLLGYLAIASVVAVAFFFAGAKLTMEFLKADLNLSVSVWRRDREPSGEAPGGDDDGDDPDDDGEFPDDDPDPQDTAAEPEPEEPAPGGQRPHVPQQARHRISVLNRDAWPLLVGATRGRHRPGAGRIPCQRLVEVAHGLAA